MLEASASHGKFEFKPLESGFGITIGNALRRILLSSLEGFAITSIRIEGVQHEFATIDGVIEDVTNIILNLKQVRLKAVSDTAKAEQFSIEVKNKTVFKAGDLNSVMHNFEVLNPDLVICNIDQSASFKMDFTVNRGRGWTPADENRKMLEELSKASAPDEKSDPNRPDKPFSLSVDTIPIDSIYTPIVNVKYTVEPYRISQKTDFDKLLIEIDTDGSIHPKEALKEAARILIHHFMLFSDEKITVDLADSDGGDDFDEDALHVRQLLKTRLVDLDLSVRAINCLKAADVETLAQLVSYNRNDLLKFRNFGKKSLVELDDKLESLNLSFGMDISKYKLDKEDKQ